MRHSVKRWILTVSTVSICLFSGASFAASASASDSEPKTLEPANGIIITPLDENFPTDLVKDLGYTVKERPLRTPAKSASVTDSPPREKSE